MKIFRDTNSSHGQVFLLPPSVNEFVGEDDPARALGEIIDALDTGPLTIKRQGGGAPAYNPVMMTKVMVFSYSEGIRSSRKIAKALSHDMRLMYLSEMSKPDFRTIARFRRENEQEILDVFVQVVRLAQEMGLVFLDHVSCDGTKIEANVSGKETYSKDRLEEVLLGIKKRIAEVLAEAEEADLCEDAQYGDSSGNEIEGEMRELSKRQARLEELKEKLAESGRKSIAATDLDSRVMKTKSGNRPGYNMQAVVDREHQIIVAADVSQGQSDNRQLSGMLEHVKETTGMKPSRTSADGGYWSRSSLEYIRDEDLDAYIPDNKAGDDSREGFEYDQKRDEYTCPAGSVLKFYMEREKSGREYRVYRCYQCSRCPQAESCHGKSSRYKELWQRTNCPLETAMSEKMKAEESKDVYRWRMQIVEPVFANIKVNMDFLRLLLRGLEGAKIEFYLACIAHNIGKIRPFWGEFRHSEAAA